MADVEKYLKDFGQFCEEGLRRTLRSYQMEPARAVLRSVLGCEGRTIAILMARQAGKNELIACLSLWMLLRLPGIKIGIYAPTFPQAIDIGMRRIKRHFRWMTTQLARKAGITPHRRKSDEAPPPPLTLDLPLGVLSIPKPDVDRQDFIEFPAPEKTEGPFAEREEGSMLGAHSADKEAEKEGYTWDVILYDEAQDIDRVVIDEEISPMGSSTSATEVLIGTPYRIDCKFYDVIQALKEGTLPGECFEYSYEAVVPLVPEYRRFVEKKARELGRDSVAFRTQYGLEWVQGLGLFFDFDLFRTLAREDEEFLSCAARDAADATSHILHPTSPISFAVGIDLAGDDPGRTGRTDYTAIAVLRRDGEVRTLVDLYQWRGKDWERQFHDITRLLRGLPGRVQVTIDATGMGDPFSDRIRKELVGCPLSIERLKLTSASKSEVGLYAEQEIAGERVFYAAGPRTLESGKLDEFLRQVRWLVREHLQDKAVRWYVSEDKGHDDLVCAFFLALWASRRSPVRRSSLAEIAAVDAVRYE